MTTQRATCWSVTINNPTAADDECIALARQKGWTVEGQLEVGAEGTPHYQLMVRTPQVRFSAVKKAFPRAHIEQAHNPAALARYVAKEDTRVGQLVESSDQYPSLSKLWELMFDWFCNLYVDREQQIKTDHSGVIYFEYQEDERRFPIGVTMKVNSRDLFRDLANQSDPLRWFDRFIRDMIRRGYRVETMATNPQIRSAFKMYFAAIMEREALRRVVEEWRVENDVEFNLPEVHNPDGDEEEISPPSPPSSPPPHGSAPDPDGSSGSA